MTKETKRVLTVVAKALMNGKDRQSSREIANVLSALRGPDNDTGKLKKTRTSPLRKALLKLAIPRSERAVNDVYYVCNGMWDLGGSDEVHLPDTDVFTHFDLHAELAAEVLGVPIIRDALPSWCAPQREAAPKLSVSQRKRAIASLKT